MRNNEVLDICEDDIPEEVSLRLKCAKCGHLGRYRTQAIYVDPEFQDKSRSPEDYISFGTYFRCRKCKSAWPWEFTPDTLMALSALMFGKAAGINDNRVIFGKARMYDGTRFHSPAQAEDHLLGIIERQPGNAFAWNRLGNVYLRAGLIPKAMKAFTKALEIDPDEIESHYTMGGMLLDKGRHERAAEHLQRVLRLAHGHAELAGDDLRQTVRSTLDMLCEIHAKTDGKVDAMPFDVADRRSTDKPMTIRLESFDLGDEDDIERAVDMFIGKKQAPSRPAASLVEKRLKVGRNDPCPCGSGAKYKKCCGR